MVVIECTMFRSRIYKSEWSSVDFSRYQGMSRQTLAAVQSSGLTEVQLNDPDAIIVHIRSRAKAGRGRHV